ncbi:MAG: hypothetical protein Q4P32_00990 [Micrococcales bacterium]|nr:hypothetical protein [Micrococcales bacterium]
MDPHTHDRGRTRDSDDGRTQDAVRSAAYQAPIPPFEDTAQQSHEPRYVKAEPLPPRTPFGPGGPRFGGDHGYFSSGQPVTLPRKSLLLAGLLGGLLGPLGMLYSTFFGAFVMTGVFFWGVLFTGGQVAPILLLWSALWSVWAAHRKNERRRAMELYLSNR